MVRYAYLALNLHGKAPKWLVWLRYSMFYVLYPVGIGAEWWLMYRAAEPAGEISVWAKPVFYFLLALYVPGEYHIQSSDAVCGDTNLSGRRLQHVHIYDQAEKESSCKVETGVSKLVASLHGSHRAEGDLPVHVRCTTSSRLR